MGHSTSPEVMLNMHCSNVFGFCKDFNIVAGERCLVCDTLTRRRLRFFGWSSESLDRLLICTEGLVCCSLFEPRRFLLSGGVSRLESGRTSPRRSKLD